ncbi:SRPBCC domain-containing protein [Pelagibius sp. Alg239-R121]|uniref:SRPBCC family protein n=1 Tax=Pelagibius sp. Alg239-R121 TaxID=2993448 RepID=UPI0024A6C323|nr:SRPBCC domain-containing protein [Pelagibius sp. Alg239-R121]
MSRNDSVENHASLISAEKLIAQRSYRATPEAVFDAWVNPSSLAKWFGPPGFRAEVLSHDLRVGGLWRFLMKNDGGDAFHHFGTFIEIRPPHKLIFSWASEEQVEGWRDANGKPTLVTVELAPCQIGTEVTVTHEKLVSDFARQALFGGWNGGLLCLEDFLLSKETTT